MKTIRGIRRFACLLGVLLLLCQSVAGQGKVRLEGNVYDSDNGDPIEFVSILLTESGLWAITNEKGHFVIKDVPKGKTAMTLQCLGYQKRIMPMTVERDITNLKIRLKPDNLKLSEVTVMAHRKQNEATTSYTIDRQTLDNQQLLSLSDISVLLPGGKTRTPSLMGDERLSLRSSSQEKGNASFGTAVEVDGMRLDNNAAEGETTGASTRTVGTSSIESVEIIAGIPSVEYGDLSNGVVKVNTRRGKSPFIVEGSVNQHTRQVAVNKGFNLGRKAGVLNASVEHARSFGDAASPHTAYQRNILGLHYMNTFFSEGMPLTLNMGITANVGGYNSEADPDNHLDDYTKVRDNVLRANASAQWLLNRPWITNLELAASFSYSDRKRESYTSTSSASTQPYLHATDEGYYMAGATGPVILGPTGYWYVLGFNDSKPLAWNVKLKAMKTLSVPFRQAQLINRLMVGADYRGSRNAGRGTYYDDMSVAPTWREYRYDRLPTMHNMAFYAEDKVSLPTGKTSAAELTAGLRDDITMIGGSDYGTVSSLSPRVNGRYVFWRRKNKRAVSDLELHAGWGKSVKQPSFQVLYPSPSYADRLVFASASTSTNVSYYAYHTYPSAARYNPQLRWQYTNQTDLGVEFTVKGTRVSLSAFHHRTCRSYMSTGTYTPMQYQYTPTTSANVGGVAADNRRFAIDSQTGIVTMTDATGTIAPQQLASTERRSYAVNTQYANATPLDRYGLEWIVDFAQIKALHTSLRLDGNYYEYKGTDDVLFADIPLGISSTMTGNVPYQYVGYYRGSNVTSTAYTANASVSNGSLQRQVNLNGTLTTHLPSVRMIITLRVESSLLNYRRLLSELSNGQRGIVLNDGADIFGTPYDGKTRDHIVALYPEYYSTWDDPSTLIPFAEKLQWAHDNDASLYNDLTKLIVRSNYPYTMNPNRMSAYYSANLSVTKEIGDHISVSFYANNFLNNMKRIRSSQTGLETSLFASGYIPNYYYGLSLRLKL
ncbi:MAG: TonB-dependent receptor [Prevotella sp.]|nr:TonB-dependent receptor [Prevotella sp.]